MEQETQKRERCRWGVFPIIHGCSQACAFDGPNRDCVRYVRRERKRNPAIEYIISPLYLY